MLQLMVKRKMIKERQQEELVSKNGSKELHAGRVNTSVRFRRVERKTGGKITPSIFDN